MSSDSPFEVSNVAKQNIKHKIVDKNINFNLNGIAEIQSTSSDHTPTPTRFIRNCEEVGLFQDLQNVNPFEEDFRKALNYDITSKKLLLAEESSCANDGTLHTPKIIYNASVIHSLAKTTDNSQEVIAIDCESFSDDGGGFGMKIIQHKNYTSTECKPSIFSTSQVNTKKMQMPHLQIGTDDTGKGNKYKIEKSKDLKERRRESNRNATRRAYQRRIQAERKIQGEVERLKSENDKLKRDNIMLSMEVISLQCQLKAHTRIASNDLGENNADLGNKGEMKPNTISHDCTVSSKIETVLNNVKVTKCRTILPKLPLIAITPEPLTSSSKIGNTSHLNGVISIHYLPKSE